MSDDLKPCPFCGEMPKYYPDPGGGGPYIFCENDAGCYVRPSVWPKLAGRGVNIVSAWNRRAAPQWQPIETAPRDGTPVLTYSADAAADPRQGPVGNPCTPILVMAYIVGEWELVDEIGDWHIPQYDPTHWMPLPAPPVDSSAAPSTPVDNKISADPVGKEG